MKKFLVLLLLALPALATDYVVTMTVNQDAILERARVRSNGRICQAVGLPTNCTKVQATAINPTIGADFSNTVATFISKRAKDIVQAEKATSDAEDVTTFDQAWAAASQANRDSACVTLGLPAGCKP